MAKVSYRVRDSRADQPELSEEFPTIEPAQKRFKELATLDNITLHLEAVLQPCANAPLVRTCDSAWCDQQAVVDAPSPLGPWGYWCADHWDWRHNTLRQANVLQDDPLPVTLAAVVAGVLIEY